MGSYCKVGGVNSRTMYKNIVLVRLLKHYFWAWTLFKNALNCVTAPMEVLNCSGATWQSMTYLILLSDSKYDTWESTKEGYLNNKRVARTQDLVPTSARFSVIPHKVWKLGIRSTFDCSCLDILTLPPWWTVKERVGGAVANPCICP